MISRRVPSGRTNRLLWSLGLIGAMTGCLNGGGRETLSELHTREPDLADSRVDHGLHQAMEGYRKFLEEAPESALTPEAMRRLADLQLEAAYGTLSGPEGASASSAPGATGASGAAGTPSRAGRLPPPPSAAGEQEPSRSPRATAIVTGADTESREDFEQRTLAPIAPAYASAEDDVVETASAGSEGGGPLEAIELYDRILETYPDYAHADQVLYQKARAFDELGRVDEAVEVASRLIDQHPGSRHVDELLFRRGEYYFVRKQFLDAEKSYARIVSVGSGSDYYELALYKLGWSFYKQMMLEEALKSYVMLLDYKVATGYDFDQVEDEADAQRIADTYRVTSLCFSDLGGAEAVSRFFEQEGARSYEDRVYRQLGEFYLEKLRYADAASAYETFVDLYPNHAKAPHFSMRVIEIYEAGDFPQLVLEAKQSFAARYAVTSPYWSHFDLAESTEIVGYLKQNLDDLASHYHARFQQAEDEETRAADFAQSERWYREYLESFRTDPETPALHHRFADLLLEYERFGEAAREYESIAYDYPAHDRSAAAGYAAVFAHRQALDRADGADAVRREVIASSLRFGEAFPTHEHAPAVVVAAVDDLYALGEHDRTIEVGRRLIDEHPSADRAILRNAWLTVAHASFDSGRYVEAEGAYAQVRELSADEVERAEVTDNLAAAIYKQGEQAKDSGDARAAADHFLRVADVAPDSGIRPLADYDGAAALVAVEDWGGAAEVLEGFRASNPEHELHAEATRQIAFVYESAGETSKAASEYERVADEAGDPELRGEALLHAGELHEKAGDPQLALDVYDRYVTEFTDPLEVSVVTRFKMAEIHGQLGDDEARLAELARIVSIDAGAGDARTATVRTLAARSALLLAEPAFELFASIELTQPFDQSLRRKRSEMSRLLAELESLVDYGVGEVTAGATYYIAETYDEFSRALRDSERPADLSGSDLMDYEDVLEEEAFPFEERAISVHEKNLELAAAGVWSDWIEKSLGRLAERVPGRYARREQSAGPLESIDRYVYRSPRADLQATGQELASDATPAEVVADAPTQEEAEEPEVPFEQTPADDDLASSSAVQAADTRQATDTVQAADAVEAADAVQATDAQASEEIGDGLVAESLPADQATAPPAAMSSDAAVEIIGEEPAVAEVLPMPPAALSPEASSDEPVEQAPLLEEDEVTR